MEFFKVKVHFRERMAQKVHNVKVLKLGQCTESHAQ